ncbi:hypothetical protein ABZP36_012058 [Zizania latifolia]
MELHGGACRQQGSDGGGVTVKFIETRFISSDAASFKSVVQRLTGKSAPSPTSSPPPQPTLPRPNRPHARAAVQRPASGAGWAVHGGHYALPGSGSGRDLMAPPMV